MRVLARRKRNYLQFLLLILPALIIYSLFHVIPILQDLGIAMSDALSVGSKANFVGFRNFKTLLFDRGPQNEMFFRSFFWTLIFWLGNWTLNIVMGFGFALMLYERVKFRKTFLIVIFLPYVVSNLAIGFIIRLILDPSNGAINWLLLKSSLVKEPLQFLREGWTASLTLILITGWKFAGFNLVLFLAGLVMIPKDTLEAAIIDGCSYFQKLFRIIIPQMWPSIIAVSVLCFTGTWQLFALPVALTGTTHGGVKSIDVLAVVFYRWAFGREGVGLASAMMVIIALLLLLGSLILQNLIKKKTVEY